MSISPYHHIRAGLPPTIIFHGRDDPAVPFESVEAFTKAMKAAGNDCRLVGFDDKGHAFFNADRGDGKAFETTVQLLDEFLVDLGYLEKPASPKTPPE